MKWFWSIMVLLALATGLLLARRGSAPAIEPAPELIAQTESAPTPSPEPEATPPTPSATSPRTTESALAAPQAEKIPSPDPIVEPAAPQTPIEAPATPVTTSVDSTPVETAPTVKPADQPAEPPAAPVEATAAPASSAPTEASAPSETPAPAEPPPALFKDQFEIVPARTKPGENGVTIYDERFPLKGAGTLEDPMEVSWEYLVSASETFQPRMGKKRLPERITVLDGKHVRVTGYVAFPIMAASQNEMLSMRNMWDGCCIGVPPTPYDALEVKLKAPATGKDRFTAFGTVEGTLKVDPYIKGNWLLGLYLMEDGKLSQLKEGGDPGKHGGM